MIAVLGHLEVDPADRDRLLDLSQEAVRQARTTEGCLHFAVTPDPLDPSRVDVAERWRDRPSLEAFRGAGTEGELGAAIRSAHVEEVETPERDDPGTAAEIRALLDERARAVAEKDVATLAARFGNDLDSFGVTPPQREQGLEGLVEGTRAWLDSYSSPIDYEVHDLQVTSDGGLAVAAFVYRVTGTLRTGTEVDMWVRATDVLRRGDGGRWVVVHQHESVPWDPETGQGLLAPGT